MRVIDNGPGRKTVTIIVSDAMDLPQNGGKTVWDAVIAAARAEAKTPDFWDETAIVRSAVVIVELTRPADAPAKEEVNDGGAAR